MINHIKNEIDTDHLGQKKPKVSPSVGIIGHPLVDHHSKALFEIKAGLKDERPV